MFNVDLQPLIKQIELFTQTQQETNKREEILYRDDIKVSFGYALTGIAISLALAGVIYVVGKKLIVIWCWA